MVKINSRCYIVEVNGVQYVVKYGKIDEFLCLFLPSVVIVSSMIVCCLTPSLIKHLNCGFVNVSNIIFDF